MDAKVKEGACEYCGSVGYRHAVPFNEDGDIRLLCLGCERKHVVVDEKKKKKVQQLTLC